MKTGNFPRVAIVGCYLPFAVGEDDWLISITNGLGLDAETMLPFERKLYLKFDDVNDVRELHAITAEQGLEIATFIKEARDLQKNVWVNCHAGICRSGAVTSLLIDLGWEDAKCAISPGRIPNHLVYQTVRQHFPELRQSWDKDPK